MNKRGWVCALIAGMSWLSIDGYAKTPLGSDNFDNGLSPNWMVFMNPLLVAQNKRLEYVAPGSAAGDSSSILWNNYTAGNFSWTYSIDVSMPIPNPALDLQQNQTLFYGLEARDNNNNRFFSYVTEFFNGTTFERDIAASELLAGQTNGQLLGFANVSNAVSTVQFHFDQQTGTLSAEYDADGPDATGNRSFTQLASFGAFDLNSILVFGQSTAGLAVGSAANVYGDNAQSQIVPEPSAYGYTLCGIALTGWLLRRKRRRSFIF